MGTGDGHTSWQLRKLGDGAVCVSGLKYSVTRRYCLLCSSCQMSSHSRIKWMISGQKLSSCHSIKTPVSWPSRIQDLRIMIDSHLEVEGFGELFALLDMPQWQVSQSVEGCFYMLIKTGVKQYLFVKHYVPLTLNFYLYPYYLFICPGNFHSCLSHWCTFSPEQTLTRPTQVVDRTVYQLQVVLPDAPNLIHGNFNHCKLGKNVCNFYQYVICATQLLKCLDLCCGSVKGAYKSLHWFPLEHPDHNDVHCLFPPINCSWERTRQSIVQFCFGPRNLWSVSKTVSGAQTGMFLLHSARTWSLPKK